MIEWNVLPNPVCYGLGSILYELKMLAPGFGFCEGVTRGRSEVGLGVVGLSNFELSHKRIKGEVIPPLFGFLSLLS